MILAFTNRACLLALTLSGIAVSAHAQLYQWKGTTSTNVTVGTNYVDGTAPATGGSVTGALTIENGVDNAFTYTAAQGATTFSGYTYIGQNNVGTLSGAGSMSVTGGTLSFGSATNTSGLNQNVLGLSSYAGALNVSGGTVNFLAGSVGDTNSLWVGNASDGAINLSGGAITIQNGLQLARDGGNASLNITGGLFQVQGSSGTSWRASGGTGTATVNLSGSNLGVFEQTNSATFATGISFQFGYLTGGQFKLISATNPFGNLASVGDLSYQTTLGGSYVQLDNVPTDSNYYLKYLGVTSAGGEYTLSVIPEPATWIVGALCVIAAGCQFRARFRSGTTPISLMTAAE